MDNVLLQQRRPSTLFSSLQSHNYQQHLHTYSYSAVSISLNSVFLSLHNMSSEGLKLMPKKKSIGVFCRSPARDTIINFGKYKGRMMGTLPPRYLRWVVENVSGGPTGEWSELAEQVLEDPFYRDRLEWEKVQMAMDGCGKYASSVVRSSSSPGADIFQMATRFGWDMDDEAGWRKVNFSLLGTSKGGRIPRIKDRPNRQLNLSLQKQMGRPTKAKSGFGSSVSANTFTRDNYDGVCDDPNGLKAELLKRRETRRARQKSRKDFSQTQLEQLPKGSSPFPGREALLRKIGGAG